MLNTEPAIVAARSYIGTPFVHQGRQPGLGLDCVGMVFCAFLAAGWQPLWTATADAIWRPEYPDPPDGQWVLDRFSSECDEIDETSRDALQPCDLMLFSRHTGDLPQYVTMISQVEDVRRPLLIHVHYAYRRVMENHFAPGFLPHLHSVWRVRQ